MISAMASGVSFRLHAKSVPFLPGALEAATYGLLPEGMYHNLDYVSPHGPDSSRVQSLLATAVESVMLSGVSPEKAYATLKASMARLQTPELLPAGGGQGFSGAVFLGLFAMVLQAQLPENKAAEIGIINLFEQGGGDILTFNTDDFAAKDVLVNGERRNLSAYIVKNKIDTKLPLVADYYGALVNISFQDVDEVEGLVKFYAPVFSGIRYKHGQGGVGRLHGLPPPGRRHPGAYGLMPPAARALPWTRWGESFPPAPLIRGPSFPHLAQPFVIPRCEGVRGASCGRWPREAAPARA